MTAWYGRQKLSHFEKCIYTNTNVYINVFFSCLSLFVFCCVCLIKKTSTPPSAPAITISFPCHPFSDLVFDVFRNECLWGEDWAGGSSRRSGRRDPSKICKGQWVINTDTRMYEHKLKTRVHVRVCVFVCKYVVCFDFLCLSFELCYCFVFWVCVCFLVYCLYFMFKFVFVFGFSGLGRL